MPRRDFFHFQIRAAFEKAGWTITADPFRVIWEGKTFLPDLAAERIFAAQKGPEKIAIEVKSFLGDFNFEFYEALGQFDSYRFALADFEPDRAAVLAISSDVFEEYFEQPFVQRLIELKKISLSIIDIENKIIEKWINPPFTEKQ